MAGPWSGRLWANSLHRLTKKSLLFLNMFLNTTICTSNYKHDYHSITLQFLKPGLFCLNFLFEGSLTTNFPFYQFEIVFLLPWFFALSPLLNERKCQFPSAFVFGPIKENEFMKDFLIKGFKVTMLHEKIWQISQKDTNFRVLNDCGQVFDFLPLFQFSRKDYCKNFFFQFSHSQKN